MGKVTDTLFVIPARGGSKGLYRKNIRPMDGKPLIYYSIDSARGIADDRYICVSTDDIEIKQIVESYNLHVPFLRPDELATDFAGTREVILHALRYYEDELGLKFNKVCILQPTSPLRTTQHIIEAFKLWNDNLDMVVSVRQAKANPYFTLYEEDRKGYLTKLMNSTATRKQDVPKLWELNGAIYIVNSATLKISPFHDFQKVVKYEMGANESIDIDSELDFLCAELILMNINNE